MHDWYGQTQFLATLVIETRFTNAVMHAPSQSTDCDGVESHYRKHRMEEIFNFNQTFATNLCFNSNALGVYEQGLEFFTEPYDDLGPSHRSIDASHTSIEMSQVELKHLYVIGFDVGSCNTQVRFGNINASDV